MNDREFQIFMEAYKIVYNEFSLKYYTPPGEFDAFAAAVLNLYGHILGKYFFVQENRNREKTSE